MIDSISAIAIVTCACVYIAQTGYVPVAAFAGLTLFIVVCRILFQKGGEHNTSLLSTIVAGFISEVIEQIANEPRTATAVRNLVSNQALVSALIEGIAKNMTDERRQALIDEIKLSFPQTMKAGMLYTFSSEEMKVVMKEFTESLLNDEELRSSILKAAAEVTSVVAEDTSVADNIKKITGNLCRSVYKDGVETAQYYIPFVPKRDSSSALVVKNGMIAAKNA